MKPDELQTSLKGAVCVMLTPYKPANMWEVDHAALRQNLRFLVKHNVKAVAMTDSDGECPALTDEERKVVWKTAVEEAKGKVALIAGSSHYSLKGALDFVRYGEEIGVDGFMAIAPYYHNFDQDGIFSFFKAIAEATSLGLVVDNSPSYAKLNFSPTLLAKLAQVPNIVGVKENSSSMPQFTQTLRVMEEYNKPVLSGMGEVWYWPGSVVSASATGFFSIIENWWPEGVLAVADAIRTRDVDAAADFFRKMGPYMDMSLSIFKARQSSRLAVAKEPMDMLEGLNGGLVRLPLTPLRGPERVQLRRILKGLGLKLKRR